MKPELHLQVFKFRMPAGRLNRRFAGLRATSVDVKEQVVLGHANRPAASNTTCRKSARFDQVIDERAAHFQAACDFRNGEEF